jgi:hypothetical protein
MLNASNDTVTFPMQIQGRLDGENAVKMGESFITQKMKEWGASLDLQKEYP